MQTFMPYPNIVQSVGCLDSRRLGKQRVEALQILRIVTGMAPRSGWRHHPAVRMWEGHAGALAHYMNQCVTEWIRRGYRNTMALHPPDGSLVYPWWMGDERLHGSHRANLLRKDRAHYGRYGWTESIDLPYFWPASSRDPS